MKFIKFILFMSITCCILFTSCKNENNSDTKTYTQTTKDILTSMVDASSKLPAMDTVDSNSDDAENLFSYICDFDYSKVDSFSFTYSSEGTAEEISVIKVKDSTDIDELQSLLQDRITLRSNTFKTYKPEEVPTVDNATIVTEGPYISLIITASPSTVKTAFETCFK